MTRALDWSFRAFAAAAIFAAAFAVGCATGGGQPHMRSALEQLQAAKSELDLASADKGGHRLRAIELVNEAIEQTERGLEFAAAR